MLGALHSIIAGSSSVASVVISIAFMLFFGFAMTRITKLLKLPNVTAYIITGILLGPFCLNIVPSTVTDGMEFLADIALAFIAFSTGEFFKFETLKKNGGKVVIITILSIIFLINDKKEQHNVRVYKWYIRAGVLHLLIGTVGLTPMIYSVVTLVFALKNKKHNITNNLSIKSNNALIIFSSILIASIIFMFVAENTNLFYKIKKN